MIKLKIISNNKLKPQAYKNNEYHNSLIYSIYVDSSNINRNI